MPEKERFVVSDHVVVDTKLRRYAPFGHVDGAGSVCAAFNAGTMDPELFTWVDGDPRKPEVKKELSKQQGAVNKPSSS